MEYARQIIKGVEIINDCIYIKANVKVKSVEAVCYDGTVKSLQQIAKGLGLKVIVGSDAVYVEGIIIPRGWYIVRSKDELYREPKDTFEKKYTKF